MSTLIPSSILVQPTLSPADSRFEVVERKGIGHPDTLADALAERMSVAYSRHSIDMFGAILHHNLDKLYLRGGHARTAPGTFEMTEPVVLVIGGRVSTSFAGQLIDYRSLFDQVARDYMARVLPTFDARKWLTIEHATTNRSRFETWFQPRNLEDLPELRNATASDTVAVTAWWPATPTEDLVLRLERYLNQEAAGPRYSHLGQDIKVMAIRENDHVVLTLNVPVLADAASSVDVYNDILRELGDELLAVAKEIAKEAFDLELRLNTQGRHPYAQKRQYILGTGTCLEFGEEGFVGRGNGALGLISVFRPKSVEAPYGKNPTYHAGKVYTLYADQIAREIHDIHGVGTTVTIVAANGDPLRQPSAVSIGLQGDADSSAIKRIVRNTLEKADHIDFAINQMRLVPR